MYAYYADNSNDIIIDFETDKPTIGNIIDALLNSIDVDIVDIDGPVYLGNDCAGYDVMTDEHTYFLTDRFLSDSMGRIALQPFED